MRSRRGERRPQARADAPRPLAPLTIERIGARGDGIAHHAGQPIYVPFTVPGDRILARLGVSRGEGREARATEILQPGEGRAVPPCPHFGRCGGCALQHLDCASYEAIKLASLHETLARGGLDPKLRATLLSVPASSRRRARLGLSLAKGRGFLPAIGFRARFSHDLVDLQACFVMEPGLLALVAPLRRIIPDILAPGEAGEAILTRVESGMDLVIEAATAPSLQAMEALAALAQAGDLGRVTWRSKREELPIAERRPMRIVLSGVAVPFPPGAFLQASEAAERLLVAAVLAGLDAGRPALDLYSGLGVFALALAAERRVHAVEGDPRAAAALASGVSARPALADRVSVERRDLETEPLRGAELDRYEVAVIDPPRAGARRQIEAIGASDIDMLIYVSCNPATFVRDARHLVGSGFRIEGLTAIDQFVWSPHLEIVASFRR